MYTSHTLHKIAVTGGIGSGKSVVSRLLRMMGVPVYDCDTEAKRLMDTSLEIREALVKAVGADVYGADGCINRPYLASYMFSNPEHVAVVNHIVHPVVRTHFSQWAKLAQAPIVAVETAILYESGMDADVDSALLVQAPLDLRIQRAMLRDGADEQSIRRRISAQTPDEELLQKATYVILNDDSASLIAQIRKILTLIAENSAQ